MYATPQQQNIMKYPPCLPSKPRNVKAAKKSLRYFCMARNRDNNGDGKIDRSELRWYTASIKQLVGLYVGNSLIDPHSRLYYRSKAEQDSPAPNKWRQHTISSTKYSSSSKQPTVIWGEEGTSLGDISGSIQWGSTGGYAFNRFSVRCVRNLGMAADHALSEVPEDYITVSPDPAGSDLCFPPHLLLLPPSRAAPDAKTSLAYTTGPFSAPHCPARPSRTTEGLILYGAMGPAVTGPPLAHC